MKPAVVKVMTEPGIITPGDVLYLYPDKTIILNDEYAKDIIKEDIRTGMWQSHGYALDPTNAARFRTYKHPRLDDNTFVRYIFKSNPEWDTTGKDRKCIIDLEHTDINNDSDCTVVGQYSFKIVNGCTDITFYYRTNRVVIKPHISDENAYIEYYGVNRICIRA